MIVKKEICEIEGFFSDESGYKGSCDAVYFPENEEEIIDLIIYCNKEKIKITIAGAGTGLTSGRVPEGGVVISLEKLNKILELNKNEKYLIVQPAVFLGELQKIVEAEKLFYPPDPTERNCFIGATVAANSSGARTFKYGPTRSYVEGLRIILPNGDILSLNRGQYIANNYEIVFNSESGEKYNLKIPEYKMPDTKNSAGYFCKRNMDLIDLFIGSEGTLGVITEIKLRLLDLPKSILSCVVFFITEENALNFIEEARVHSQHNDSLINARGLEYFDKYTLDFLLTDYPNIPKNSFGAVWFEQEINDREEDIINAWTELISKHNGIENESWFAVDKNEQEKFKEFRHRIAVKVNEFIAHKGLKKVGTDVAVPHQVFREYYYYAKRIIEDAGLKYVVYGHLGNSHMHLNMLPENQEEFIVAKKLYYEICIEAIRLKGTFSAEHGVGKLKRDYLIKLYGEEVIKQMAKLKLSLDPNKILNVGNIFEPRYLS